MTRSEQIRAREADAIRQVLARHGGIHTAILFGSIAKAGASPQSDIDVAVSMGTRLTAETKLALIDELASATGRPVDLIDLRTAGEPLLGQILRHGIRLLGSNSDYAELIKRHLFAEADFVPYQRRILTERRRAWIGN